MRKTLLAGICGMAAASAVAGGPRIVNIINFARAVEPRIADPGIEETLYKTTETQAALLRKYNLKGTFLLQYDALIRPNYQQLMKAGLVPGSEVGAWFELTQPHVEAAGLKWRGKYPWDWRTHVGFSVGYTPDERVKLVDAYMSKFKEIFGAYPKSVGSWFIDARTLAYMSDKYGIAASCNCKDQIGTDGYTLWGGYWNQAYYPSRKNAYMPAQTAAGGIPVPVFRMLGSDPIYQYDTSVGGNGQGVITLEPVYTGRSGGGGIPAWCDWFFRAMYGDSPCLAFAYAQAGQENSFTWNRMKGGLEYQIPQIAKLRDAGKASVQTLAESGEWFKKSFPLTPATAVTALEDWQGKGRKSVWYDSRFYRANLFWDGGAMSLRDVHLFDEDVPSAYLDTATRSDKCVYETIPVIDGAQWHTALRFYTDAGELKGGDPAVTEQNGALAVTWPLTNAKGALKLLFEENRLTIESTEAIGWRAALPAAPGAAYPFTSKTGARLTLSAGGTSYSLALSGGALATRDGEALGMIPDGKRLAITRGEAGR